MNDLQDLECLSRGRKGAITRGKTARERLRSADVFLSLKEKNLISQKLDKAWYCDLGFGDEVHTLAQSSEILRRINPHLPVLGVEINPQRVDRARTSGLKNIAIRLGGFELPLESGESVRILRVFNVLRQYKACYYKEALGLMAPAMMPGGLLLEGTSNPWGSLWSANVFRKNHSGSLDYEALVFRWGGKEEFSPALFPPILPRNLVEQMTEGQAIHVFFKAWEEVYEKTRQMGMTSSRSRWKKSAELLNLRGYETDLQKKYLSRGFLIVGPDNIGLKL